MEFDRNGKPHASNASTFLVPASLTLVRVRNERPTSLRQGSIFRPVCSQSLVLHVRYPILQHPRSIHPHISYSGYQYLRLH